MTTKNQVPRENGEGSIGKSSKYWGAGYFNGLYLGGKINGAIGANIASAATVNLSAATGQLVHITGTTAITSITMATGQWCTVIFDGVLTLTHNATTNNLPGLANITTAAGDRALYYYDGIKIYCVWYQRATGISPAFQGVYVYRGTSSQSIPTSTATKITLNTVGYDTNSYWDSTNVRINIPSGIKMVRLSAGLVWSDNPTTSPSARGLYIYKNGSSFFLNTITFVSPGNQQLVVPPTNVSSGDYFELYAINIDSASKVVSNDLRTYLSMEVVV